MIIPLDLRIPFEVNRHLFRNLKSFCNFMVHSFSNPDGDSKGTVEYVDYELEISRLEINLPFQMSAYYVLFPIFKKKYNYISKFLQFRRKNAQIPRNLIFYSKFFFDMLFNIYPENPSDFYLAFIRILHQVFFQRSLRKFLTKLLEGLF